MRGEITMWIEIPVEVTFEYDEGEKQTRDYIQVHPRRSSF